MGSHHDELSRLPPELLSKGMCCDDHQKITRITFIPEEIGLDPDDIERYPVLTKAWEMGFKQGVQNEKAARLCQLKAMLTTLQRLIHSIEIEQGLR